MKLIKRTKICNKAGFLFIVILMIFSTVMTSNAEQGSPSTSNESDDPNPLTQEAIYFYDPSTIDSNSILIQSASTWEAAIKVTPDELSTYEGWYIIAARFYHNESGNLEGTLKIYDEGVNTYEPGNVITTEDFSVYGSGWHRVDLTESVEINIDNEVWISFEIESNPNDHPISVDDSESVFYKGDLIYMDNTWRLLWTFGYVNNWCIEAIVSSSPDPLEAHANGPYAGVVGEEMQFTGSATGGEPPYTWSWDFDGDGIEDSTEQNANYTYDEAGEYDVTLTVIDSESETIDDETTATVLDPIIVNANGPYSGVVGEVIQFNGSAIGGIPPYAWEWDFGDEQTSDYQNPTHVYDRASVYQVSLIAYDSQDIPFFDIDYTTVNITETPEKTELEIGDIFSDIGTIYVEIKNIGNTDAENVTYSIFVEGGLLGMINKTTENNIDIIDVENGEIVVTESFILGFGNIEITVTAEADNADRVEDSCDAKVILFFIII